MQLVCPACLALNRVPRERLADGPVCGKCRMSLRPHAPLALNQRDVVGFSSSVLFSPSNTRPSEYVNSAILDGKNTPAPFS
jgi:hypothetical protein